MTRRRSAVLAITASLITLSSCATFDRNGVAARVGDHSLSAKAAEALSVVSDNAVSGDQLRQELTKWIRVTVLEGSTGTPAPSSPSTAAELDSRLSQALAVIGVDRAKTLYEGGVDGSPLICLAAITVASIDDANNVLTQLQSGMAFADAARQFSTDTVIAEAGGIVKGADGQECFEAATVNPAVVTVLTGTPVGQPIVADLSTFSAVLMLRPFDELLPESQARIASASVTLDQLAPLVAGAEIYVDPRYGRWDPDSGSVVPLSS